MHLVLFGQLVRAELLLLGGDGLVGKTSVEVGLVVLLKSGTILEMVFP